MAETRLTIADVIRIISHLGGPDCSEEDLLWAADIPSGKQLLEWLASQGSAATELDDAAGTRHLGEVKNQQDVLDQTVLSPIALYQEELDVLERVRASSVPDSASSRSCCASALYALPCSLRARAQALESEADALEARAARLRRRSQLVKAATKHAKQTVSAVQKQIENADQTVQRQQERLTDLSVETDDTIGKCAQQALAILRTSEQQEEKLATLKSEIASLDRARNAIAGTVGRLYRTLDDGYKSLPPTDALEDDAATVEARFAAVSTKGPSHTPNLVEAAYFEQLEKMSRPLETSSPGGAAKIEQLLRSLDMPQDTRKEGPSRIAPNVKAELERAGRMDRLLLLQTQERGLDNAIRDMQKSLLPDLQRTYNVLHARGVYAAETEAVVSALIEELEDVNDTVDSTKQQSSATGDLHHEYPEDILEVSVTDLLKKLLGSDHAGERPTVLLNRSDVEAELASLTERSAASHRAEGKWASDVKGHLPELSRSRTTLIAAAYENSPMNTSPPFSALPAETAAKENTCSKAKELTEASARLQKESELSSRDKRKLAAYIEKWTSESK